MDRLYQKIEVGFHKEINGQWQPDRFVWQGKIHTILDIGRRWQDKDGEHILIMVPGGQVFELLLSTDQVQWYTKPPVASQMA